MAQADCAVCEALGYRSCDLCEAVIFDPDPLATAGMEWCVDCQRRGQRICTHCDGIICDPEPVVNVFRVPSPGDEMCRSCAVEQGYR